MSKKNQLHNFIVNNKNLEILESKINVFNPFDILKIEGYEIRHSNVLAWLLDPNENHNLNDYFLKKVLSDIIISNEEKIDSKINLLDIHLKSFKNSIVKRENHDIDILVVSPNNNFVFFIENKIHSKESKTQLAKYLDYVKKTYKGYNILPVFLTKTGEEASNNNYISYSHELIHGLIKETLELKRNILANDVTEFIAFYIKTLERVLGMDKEIQKLCKKIYDEHKEAIDIINQTVLQASYSLKPAFDSFENNHHELQVFNKTDKMLWFLPKEIVPKLPELALNWQVPYPFSFWLRKNGDLGICLHIEIGPLKSSDIRLKLIMFLEKEGYKIWDVAKRPESKYTKVFTKKLDVKNLDDQEEVLEKLESIYKTTEKERQKFIDTILKFDFKG